MQQMSNRMRCGAPVSASCVVSPPVLGRAVPSASPLGRGTWAPAPTRIIAARSAAEDADAELEKRLEKIRLVKGATPYGQGSKAAAVGRGSSDEAEPSKSKKAAKPSYDFTGETVFYEGTPHRGDLLVNLALGTTLVWLPLTFAAIGRGAFVNYRFTDRRLSISTNAPWKTEQVDVAYQEVKDIITVGRGVGIWGDMVVTLKDNSKVELRSLDRFQELKAYVLKRRDELAPREGVVTAAELMGETASSSSSSKKKGFA